MHSPLLSILLAFFLLTSCAAVAPTENIHYGAIKGESVLSFGASLSEVEADTSGFEDSDSESLQAGIGYFLTNEHEFGGQFLYDSSKSLDSRLTNRGLYPYYNYNFKLSERTWLHIGPHFGIAEMKGAGSKESDFSYGAQAGIRQWVTPRVAVFFERRNTYSEENEHFFFLFGVNISL
jgi:hypothetical protein